MGGTLFSGWGGGVGVLGSPFSTMKKYIHLKIVKIDIK